MPVKFAPKAVVRYEATFLNYVNQNFNALQAALNRAARETISTTAPSDPYTGETYYNNTTKTVYRWDGSAWNEEAYMGATNIYIPCTTTACTSTALTTIAWNTAGGTFSTNLMTYSTGVFTVVKAGTYCIEVTLLYDSHATGTRHALIKLNGGYVKRNAAPANSSFDAGVQVAYNIRLAASDTIAVEGMQDSPGSLNVKNVGSFFNAVRVGP